MDCVFKSWQHKNNLKEAVLGLLFLFHLRNCQYVSITQTSSPLATEFIMPVESLRVSVTSIAELNVSRPCPW
jgi:hypothetical protein